MKPSAKLLALAITAFITSPAFSQGTIECTSDSTGGTYCSGPGGYRAQGQRYTGGIESWHDNKGNQVEVREYSFGHITIMGTVRSSIPLVPHTRMPEAVQATAPTTFNHAPPPSPSGHTYFEMYGTAQPVIALQPPPKPSLEDAQRSRGYRERYLEERYSRMLKQAESSGDARRIEEVKAAIEKSRILNKEIHDREERELIKFHAENPDYEAKRLAENKAQWLKIKAWQEEQLAKHK